MSMNGQDDDLVFRHPKRARRVLVDALLGLAILSIAISTRTPWLRAVYLAAALSWCCVAVAIWIIAIRMTPSTLSYRYWVRRRTWPWSMVVDAHLIDRSNESKPKKGWLYTPCIRVRGSSRLQALPGFILDKVSATQVVEEINRRVSEHPSESS